MNPGFDLVVYRILYDINSRHFCRLSRLCLYIGIDRKVPLQIPSYVSSYRLALLFLFLALAAGAKEGTTILVIPTEALLLRSVTHVNKSNKTTSSSFVSGVKWKW